MRSDARKRLEEPQSEETCESCVKPEGSFACKIRHICRGYVLGERGPLMTDAAEVEALAGIVSDYRCKHCGKVVQRDSEKAWIKSLCGATGRTVHLTRVPSTSEGEGA